MKAGFRLRRGKYFVLLSIAIFIGVPATSQTAPSAFFQVDGHHTFGCCSDVHYLLQTGGLANFTRNAGGTGSIGTHLVYGDSSASAVLHAYENENQTDVSAAGLSVYVLGSPGTPFHLQVSYQQLAQANNRGDNYLVSVSYFSFDNFGVSAGPHEYQQRTIPGALNIDGVTSSTTLDYLGQEYSLAWNTGSTIELGANTCCGDIDAHAEAGWTVSVQVGSASCKIPTVESTYPTDWGQLPPKRTEMNWYQVLSDGHGTDFTLRSVKEVDAGSAVDTCYFDGSDIPQVTGITDIQSQGEWTVTPGNIWGSDLVGWSEDAVQYYRAKHRTPCYFLVQQQMLISCRAGEDPTIAYRDPNRLIGYIFDNTVISCRGSQCATRSYAIARPIVGSQ